MLDFFFAIEQVDPRASRIYAKHTQWDAGKDKIVTPLELVDCVEMYDSRDRNKFSKTELTILDSVKFKRSHTKFLCPVMPEKLTVRGHYKAEHFDYVSLYTEGCNLGIECYPLENIRNNWINFLTVKTHPSLDHGSDEVLSYTTDQTYFRYFDPEIRQETNIFFQ